MKKNPGRRERRNLHFSNRRANSAEKQRLNEIKTKNKYK